ARLRAGRAGLGRPREPRALASRGAELPPAAPRAVDALLRHRHPLRGLPGLPRPGRAAPHRRVGNDAEQGARLPPGGAARLDLSRPHHHGHGDRPQPAGGWAARRARSAHARRLKGAPMRYAWPEGKQSAVVLSFDFDAESGFYFREPEKAKRSLADLEERRFGPRVGVDRILRLMDRLKFRASFYIPGWTVRTISRRRSASATPDTRSGPTATCTRRWASSTPRKRRRSWCSSSPSSRITSA